MAASRAGRRPSIWLLSGTGEGPLLASRLLAAGWSVQISLVNEDALRAYAPHPHLLGRVGALAGPDAIETELLGGTLAPFRWVIDASHPFATAISADLAAVTARIRQPLLRLWRPPVPQPPGSRLTLLDQLQDLADLDLGAERLLLAIGARHLAKGVALAGARASFARILPTPSSLRLALGAGLPAEALACHRPGSGPPGPEGCSIERALLEHWRITAVLCRQSGGATERLWQELCAELGLSLLLLKRPEEPLSGARLWPLEELLDQVGRPRPATGGASGGFSPGALSPDPAARPAGGAPAA